MTSPDRPAFGLPPEWTSTVNVRLPSLGGSSTFNAAGSGSVFCAASLPSSQASAVPVI